MYIYIIYKLTNADFWLTMHLKLDAVSLPNLRSEPKIISTKMSFNPKLKLLFSLRLTINNFGYRKLKILSSLILTLS